MFHPRTFKLERENALLEGPCLWGGISSSMESSKLDPSSSSGEAMTLSSTRRISLMLMARSSTAKVRTLVHVVFDDEMLTLKCDLDIHAGIYAIFQKNLTTNVTEELVSAFPGGASRPELSRDGRTLAFVRRVNDNEVLVLK
jgi:hypothetical protein